LFFIALVFFFTQIPALHGQSPNRTPWWYTLEEGKRYFRSGAYGEALKTFENARDSRKNFYAKMERDLIAVLSIHEVRRLGDDLGLVETYIERQFRVDAGEALKELYYRYPRESFHNSAQAALVRLGILKNYPEAEYWIGESYRVEGEFAIALRQYQKAYDGRALLETPEFETEILYKMADIRRIRREYTEMTALLEEIIKKDSLWSGESFNRANMMRSLENNGIDRFLVLFRHNNPAVERAHRVLGLYYYSSGRHNRAAEHLFFAFLIQNSVIIDSMVNSRYDYAFSTLNALMRETSGRRDIQSYINDVEYYRTMYYLANSLYGNNRRRPAREIWTFLGNNAPGEWRGRAASQLQNPELDRVNESIGRTGIP
jgi:tetratricopeptide (TPR) repeat protein